MKRMSFLDILFETVFTFLSTQKSRICVFVCHHLSPGGLCMYSQFHPHNHTTLSFPSLFIFFHSWTPWRKKRLCETCDDHEVKVGCYFLCNNGCLRSYHCSLGIANGETRNTHKDQNNLNKPVIKIEINYNFKLYFFMFIGRLLFMLSQWTS